MREISKISKVSSTKFLTSPTTDKASFKTSPPALTTLAVTSLVTAPATVEATLAPDSTAATTLVPVEAAYEIALAPSKAPFPNSATVLAYEILSANVFPELFFKILATYKSKVAEILS